MRRISCKLFAEGCEKAVSRCLKLAKGTGILPLKQTGRMPNKAWPPYVSQLIPSIQKYIGHMVQTTHACRRKCYIWLCLCVLLSFINICFLLQAHSICLCILLSFEIQKTQTLTAFHHLAASLAATLHLIASSDSSDLRPCTHYQCQINLKVVTPLHIWRGVTTWRFKVDFHRNVFLQVSFIRQCSTLSIRHPCPTHNALLLCSGQTSWSVSLPLVRLMSYDSYVHLRLWSIEAPFNAYSSHCCKWMESTQLNLATPEHYLLQ